MKQRNLTFKGDTAEHHLCSWHLTQQHGPQNNDSGIQLVGSVEAAKSDVTISQRGEGIDMGGQWTGLKDCGGGKIGRLLRKLPIQLTRWHPKLITQVVVHRLHPRRAQITEPADLNGCRLAGKRE